MIRFHGCGRRLRKLLRVALALGAPCLSPSRSALLDIDQQLPLSWCPLPLTIHLCAVGSRPTSSFDCSNHALKHMTMQGLSQAVQQHEQLLKLLRANLLGSRPCPAPALPGMVVGMCMRYQQSVAAMVKDAAPVSLTGASQHLSIMLACQAAMLCRHTKCHAQSQRKMAWLSLELRSLRNTVT